MEQAKQNEKKKLELKLASHGISNRTSTTALLPPLEQSTRISNTMNNNTRSMTGIDRRIPKSVLAELHNSQQSINQTTSLLSQNDGNFFLTQFGNDPRRNKTAVRKTNSQLDLRIQKPKQKIDVIMGDLDTAISRLKNLRNPVSATKNKIRSSDSSFEEKERADDEFLFERPERNIMQTTGYSHKTNTNISVYKNREQQANQMQDNLTDGLNRFNRVMENVKERERKLFELQKQQQKLEDEEALVAQMKGESKDSAGALEAEINYFEERMNELKNERVMLSNMKSIRKRDMEILQVPYLHDKSVLRDLSEFLIKESNTLAADAKEIDQIRVRLIEFKSDQQKTEKHTASLMRDSIIKEKNYDNVERVIEQEIELTKFKHDLKKQLRQEKDRHLQQEMRSVLEQEHVMKEKLKELDEQFQQITSLIPQINSNEEAIKHFQEIKNTNEFLKEKRALTIDAMNNTRNEIQSMKEVLAKLKIDSCNVQENDIVQVEIEEQPPEVLLLEIEDANNKFGKAKQEDVRLTKLENNLIKGFSSLHELFLFSSLSTGKLFLQDEDLMQTSQQKESRVVMSISEMGIQLQKQINVLMEWLQNSGLSIDEVNSMIFNKQNAKVADNTSRNFNKYSNEHKIQEEESDSLSH